MDKSESTRETATSKRTLTPGRAKRLQEALERKLRSRGGRPLVGEAGERLKRLGRNVESIGEEAAAAARSLAGE